MCVLCVCACVDDFVVLVLLIIKLYDEQDKHNKIINTLSEKVLVLYNEVLPENYRDVDGARMGKSSNALQSLNFWIAQVR